MFFRLRVGAEFDARSIEKIEGLPVSFAFRLRLMNYLFDFGLEFC